MLLARQELKLVLTPGTHHRSLALVSINIPACSSACARRGFDAAALYGSHWRCRVAVHGQVTDEPGRAVGPGVSSTAEHAASAQTQPPLAAEQQPSRASASQRDRLMQLLTLHKPSNVQVDQPKKEQSKQRHQQQQTRQQERKPPVQEIKQHNVLLHPASAATNTSPTQSKIAEGSTAVRSKGKAGKGKQSLARQQPNPSVGTTAPASAVQSILGPTPQELQDFEALWAVYGRELQLSNEAVALVAGQVRQGILPCSAPIVKERVEQVLALDAKVPGLKSRALVAQSAATLRWPASLIERAARRVTQLLPHRDVTSVVATLMPHLSMPVEVLVLELLQLEELLLPQFCGAPVPPRLYSLHMESVMTDYERQLQRGQGSKGHTETAEAVRATSGDITGAPSSASSGSEARPVQSGLRSHSSVSLASTPALVHSQEEEEEEEERDKEGRGTGLRLSPLQLLERVQGLVSSLGGEPAYMGLTRTPRPLLSLEPGEVEARCAALQDLLGAGRPLVSQLIEARGALLSMSTASLEQQLRGLDIALGWEAPEVRSLVCEEPLVLLLPAAAVGNRWRRLQQAAQPRAEWKQLVSRSPVYCLSLLMSCPDPEGALYRMQYLGAHPSEQPGMPLERAIKITRGAFLLLCPRARTWQPTLHGQTRQQRQQSGKKRAQQGRGPSMSAKQRAA